MRQVGLQGVDLFETYVCSHRICLLEFFILQPQNRKKSNEKMGIDRPKYILKKTNTHLQKKEKKNRQRRRPRVYDTHESTLDLTQAG